MKPVLIEKTEVADGSSYTTKWYCDPPGMDQRFMVLKEQWCHGDAVRKIFKVQLIEERQAAGDGDV